MAVIGGQGFTRVEIELWFRDGAARRAAVQADIERLIATARGTVISSAVVPSIDYHAVLADLPYDQVQAVLERGPEAIELAADLSSTASLAPPRDAAPRVALLDGLPLANHAALTGRLIIDDPDEHARWYSSGQPVDRRPCPGLHPARQLLGSCSTGLHTVTTSWYWSAPASAP